MAKKPTKQPERIRCADCVHGKPHKGLAVWCEILNTGRSSIKANTKANGDILPEPKFKRIPVRVDKNTIILVREGLNVEEHLKRFKDKDNTPPGYIPWF